MLAGAEAVPEALVNWWYDRGVVIQEGYGMTENVASCCVLGREDDIPRRWSALPGRPCDTSSFASRGKTAAEAEPGESGEIWCRGPVVTPGYWRRPGGQRGDLRGRLAAHR